MARTVPLAGVTTNAPQVLLDMVSDPLSEDAIEKFTQDWQKLNKL